ncbi:agamous-like MADS-box protein AGL61 [Manihot esculenta]|uniref:MADS-box domain-containing protein n=1 Tax=Manihot esculenta TaxID=3983 RepID=A0A2C9UM51_MANES|nr:agamous-like MADS-box protein AGL61 [Manihot esculenta]OAY32168.1 hypothetical protein MANES_14G172000v8 [Manihot esculenta]
METTVADSNATPEQSRRRAGTGRRRVEIKKIQDKCSLLVTFSKRRTGLFKKLGEVCNLCGGEAAVITFSPAGKPYAFGAPSADSVALRYLTESISAASSSGLDLPEAAAVEEAEEKFWWEQPIEELDMEELREYKAGLVGLKSNLVMRIEDLKMRKTVTRNLFH